MSKGRISSIAVSAILGLALGAYFGLQLGRVYSQTLDMVEPTEVQDQLAWHSALNFSYAKSDQARAAVLLEIDTLRKLQKAYPGYDANSVIALAYVRLAMLEQKAGHQSEMEGALAEARMRYGKSHAAIPDSELEHGISIIDAKVYHIP